jgi:hypothetical protein
MDWRINGLMNDIGGLGGVWLPWPIDAFSWKFRAKTDRNLYGIADDPFIFQFPLIHSSANPPIR